MTSGNNALDWQQFHQFLLQRMNAKSAAERIRYSKQFIGVLVNGDASPLLGLSPDKRIHCMKALASLARFIGCYDRWMQIRQRYHLTWTTGNESLTALTTFFDDNKSLETMIEWVRKAIAILPAPHGAVIRFNCLTGLRPTEACESVRLLTARDTEQLYYN